MATKEEKQQLIETLKFTPTTVRMLIQGYGGESYAGRVDRKIYDYFASQKIDMDEYAGDWDGVFNENVPSELQPFSPGSPYDCDGLWHASGAELSDLNEIRVDSDDGQEIWVHDCGHGNLEDAGVTVNEFGGQDLDDLDENEVVFWGGQGEKGCFFDCEFTLRAPFDPKKLTIGYENCDGWYIINSVEYDGEELDGSGGYSTTGKWAEHKWVLCNGEEVYDSVSLDDREDEGLEWAHQTGTDNPIDFPESDCTSETWDPALELDKISLPVTDWFSSDVKPVRKGEYECEFKIVTWPWPSVRMCEWTGRTWKETSTGDKVAGDFQWRGLAVDPVEIK